MLYHARDMVSYTRQKITRELIYPLFCCFVVRGKSPGCRSMLEWLRNLLPPLTGKQYGKVELKYPEGGHCQSVSSPQGVFNVPLYFK